MHRYSAAGHGAMLADAARVEAYAAAIERSVRPGDAVLEIGTGTGLFAMLACKAGARRVYAIEADDIIEVARANAAANGLADRIEFIHALSTGVDLPERVDVVVSDLRGVLPFYESHIASIVDARTRFLAPGGRLIPQADRVMVACVEAAKEHGAMTAPWSVETYGVRMDAGRDLALNDWQKAAFDAAQLVTDAECCATLDYATIVDPNMKARVRLRAHRDALAHGLALWFDTTLAEGVGFSCAPGLEGRATIYGHTFFPWPRPVALAAGDEVAVAIGVRLVAGEYVWTWDTECAGARFRQSTFAAEPMSAARLRLRSADHVARLDDEARIDRAILESMERGAALGAIATELVARFPARFARWEDALARAGDLSVRYAPRR